ncbi:hypothetical protein Syun_016203 [Stephania yunnanensis]|uniref:Polygalacturonase n=1 Tax=Stephania yunnanensis TaxID=152371 RepID=A0AAP0P4N1_9MAGN
MQLFFTALFITSLTLIFSVSVHCRVHSSHTKKQYNDHTISQISLPHSPSPEPYNPNVNVFDVRAFGAIGDGKADDTQAFKMAWDSVCQAETESVTLLVPELHSFMLQSTIFTGPCRSNIVFQLEGTIMPPDGLTHGPEIIVGDNGWFSSESMECRYKEVDLSMGKAKSGGTSPANLTRIPSGNQLQTLADPSIYEGNSKLCGLPLSLKCQDNETHDQAPNHVNEDIEEDEGFEIKWFYVSMAVGFVVGYFGLLGTLWVKKGWRNACSMYLEGIIDRVQLLWRN